MRRVHFQGKPLASFPLTFSKFFSYLSIILAASLKRGTRARRVLVQEIADDEEVVVRVVKVADTVRRRNSERGTQRRRRRGRRRRKSIRMLGFSVVAVVA